MKPNLLKIVLLLVLQLFVSGNIWSQNLKPNSIKIDGIGPQIISKNQDSVFIKGITNLLDISFDKSRDSIEYQLIGYDDKMQSCNYPHLKYTNLPGGEYQLRYRLSSQKAFSTIYINVMQAIWQKWWFFPMIIAYVLLVAGIVAFFIFQNNYRQKLKMQLLRNKISADLHDEVGSNLSSIAIFSEVLKKKIPENDLEIKPIIEKIIYNSKESVSLMQDTVWTLNPNNDTPEKLFSKIENYARQVLSARGIVYLQVVDIEPSQLKLDMENRKNLYLILKEGINNIGKHSGAHSAELIVNQKKDKIIFRLNDDGLGFDTKQESAGNGLRNFKERAEESGFELNIESESGQGTQILLSVTP
ncbi:MAG: histidine kinase [Spirosomataceae bacterium]